MELFLLFFTFGKNFSLSSNKKSYQSTSAMQEIQPEVNKLREKFKNNPQKLNQATMQLYKTKGVNPLGGCLPMLLQMPLLFALFQVFRTTIELRNEPFIWWIKDLSAPDVIINLLFQFLFMEITLLFYHLNGSFYLCATKNDEWRHTTTTTKNDAKHYDGFFLFNF